MSNFTVVYDANIFYPAPLRDLLLRLAGTGLFRARWSKQIEEEWLSNLLQKRNDLSREKLSRTVELINKSFHDCQVEDFDHLTPCITGLPDKDDRHVLAAAMKCGAELIVTCNLKDFPSEILDQYGIEAIHPDDFIVDLLDLDASLCLQTIGEMRASLKNPSKTQEEFLETLLKQQLPQTVSWLERYKVAF
jgi:predicted nucleic acid-binding protein